MCKLFLAITILSTAISAQATRCQDMVSKQKTQHATQDAVLKVGSKITLNYASIGEKPNLVDFFVAGLYGDRVMLMQPGEKGIPDNRHTKMLPLDYLKENNLSLELRELPLITKQEGPTCLPAAVTYIQNIVAPQARGFFGVSDSFRTMLLSGALTYGPRTMGEKDGPEAQLNATADIFTSSKIPFARTKKEKDLREHIKSNGIALVGVHVGLSSTFYIDFKGTRGTEIKTLVPRSYSKDGHAMVVVGFANRGSAKLNFYSLVDPFSGQLVVVSQEVFQGSLLEAFLIQD